MSLSFKTFVSLPDDVVTVHCCCRLEYGQFHQYSPPIGLTPELGYHPAAVFSPVTALQMSEPKRAEFLTSLMDVEGRKDINSPAKKDDSSDRHKDIDGKDAAEMKGLSNGNKMGKED